MARLEGIRRFPVKGLSSEDLDEIDLVAGRGIPQDREYALALADTEFDENNPRPLPKTKFAVLARFARLAALQSQLDSQTSTLSLSRAGSLVAFGNLETKNGRNTLERALHDFVGAELGGQPCIVKGNNHRFTDISVHSLRSSWKLSPSSTWPPYARSKKNSGNLWIRDAFAATFSSMASSHGASSIC